MSTTKVVLTVTEGDLNPTARYPITASGVQQDITAGTKSAVLYYREVDSDTTLWKKTLAKIGTGATSEFEFVPDSTHEYKPSEAGEASREFTGDLLYDDTVSGYHKWHMDILHVHASPKPAEP